MLFLLSSTGVLSFVPPSLSWLPATARVRCRRARPVRGVVQVVTDIDDTIKSSGGVAIWLGKLEIMLGGVDTSFKRDSFYPGVFQFYLEIACHAPGRGGFPEKVAVLTARAEEFRFALEIKQSSKLCGAFREAGEARSVRDWGVGPVLYGSVQEWICQERKGWRKFENFRRLEAEDNEDREKQYVFVGDNGYSERDLDAAQRIIEAFPGRMCAVFLHAVSPDKRPAPLPTDESFQGVPIMYYRTYSAAAVKAAKRGLVSVDGVRRVLDAVEAGIAGDKINLPLGSENEKLYTAELQAAREWVAGRSTLSGVAPVRPG